MLIPEPMLDDVAREFPRRQVWRGISVRRFTQTVRTDLTEEEDPRDQILGRLGRHQSWSPAAAQEPSLTGGRCHA